MKPINFAFFGTDQFAVKVLEELKAKNLQPSLVVTTPDTPQGRHLSLTPPPVKRWCEENNIKYDQPEKLKTYQLPDNLDFALVAAYGKILPASLLDQLPGKFLNIHPSLLPKYRGASPLQAAIANNDPEAGVTIMVVDEEMDHGPIIAQEKVAPNQKWFEGLRDESAELGAKLLAQVLSDWLSGKLSPQAQNHEQATYTKKISKSEAEINLADDPKINFAKIRAYTPSPGAYFFAPKNGKNIRLIIKQAHLSEPGELVIDRVVPEGKKETAYTDFLNA